MTREEADEFFNGEDESPDYHLSYHDGQFFLKNAQGEVPLPEGLTVRNIDANEDGELFVTIQGGGFVVASGNNCEWFIE